MSTQPASRPIDKVAPAAFFAEQGYYIARGLFTDRLPELERDFDRIVDQLAASGADANARWAGEESERLNRGGRQVIHTHNVHRYCESWSKLWFDPRFLDLSRAFLGPDLVLHHTKLFQKPAERGAAFPMHQDWSYFPIEGDRCLAAIVHVSRADEAMGCLRIVPGSHKHGRIEDSWGQGQTSELQRRFPIEAAIPVLCEPGDVVFFHCLTVHGSGVNTHPTDVRKTVLVQLYDATSPAQEGGHHNSRLMLSGWNPHMNRDRANA